MTTFACVLKSGGVYTPRWVEALRRGLDMHAPRGFDFVCLSDVPVGAAAWRVPLEHDLPGWWSKMELFRPGVFDGPVVFFDLDTLIVGDLEDLAGYRGGLAMLTDFYFPDRAQSGVMMFTPGKETERLWSAWNRNPASYIGRYAGDGQWLHAHAQRPKRIQPMFPGQVVSYKVDAREGPPPGARVVCHHGNPRPNDPAAGWAHRAWLELARKIA